MNPWAPRKIRRVLKARDSGAEVVEVTTDAGGAFAKFLGGKEGPHVLACEWVGTQLAGKMGLPIFDFALLDYEGLPEITLHSGAKAGKGTAWITRRVEGLTWSGHAKDLSLLQNPSDIAKLVLLDRWIRNCDRYRQHPRRINRDNVFFSRETAPGRFLLLAIDHTHILTCGRPLSRDLARIDNIQDETGFGLFPEFQEIIQKAEAEAAVAAMMAIPDQEIGDLIARIPSDWHVDGAIRAALIEFLLRRRSWLATRFVDGLFPQGELF